MEKTQKWKSQFITVAIGQAISMLGSHGVQFALIWWLAEKTSSPFMLGISGLVAYLPMSLFSPLAGIAADRYNRKFISIFSDMAMGMVALIYAIILFFFDLPVWTVFIMLCVRGIGSTFSATSNLIYHSPACTERPAYENQWVDSAFKFWFISNWSCNRCGFILNLPNIHRFIE